MPDSPGALAAFVNLVGILRRQEFSSVHWPEHNRDTRCTLHMQGLENLMLCLSGGGMYRGRDIFELFLSFPALPFVGSARSASKPPAPRRHHPAARLARLGKGRPGGLTGFGLRRIDGGYLDNSALITGWQREHLPPYLVVLVLHSSNVDKRKTP